jgi:hypothetical protein
MQPYHQDGENVSTEPFTYQRGFEDGRRSAQRELREILRAWGLGNADKMNALMLVAFLNEFGKAPVPENAAVEGEKT